MKAKEKTRLKLLIFANSWKAGDNIPIELIDVKTLIRLIDKEL